MSCDIEQQLVEFLESTERNRWLNSDKIKVYVRKGRHVLDRTGEIEHVLDIAAIEVPLDAQKQGVFTRFLEFAKKVNPFAAIYVENVLTPKFQQFFERNGWKKTKESQDCPSSTYFLRKGNYATEID